MKCNCVFAGGSADPAQPLPVAKRRLHGTSELAGFYIVIDGVNAIGQGTVQFDPCAVAQRSRAA